ncbi:hypothetical protein, partial [Microbacterium sp.]|uniref:hypothetical protein n=1 Tax=Microbacterium sp. TaxID=51671 RepID=UPI0026367940
MLCTDCQRSCHDLTQGGKRFPQPETNLIQESVVSSNLRDGFTHESCGFRLGRNPQLSNPLQESRGAGENVAQDLLELVEL